MRNILFIIITSLFVSCEGEKYNPGDDPLGLSYFYPLKPGNQWIYQVQEITTNADGSIIEEEYQLSYSIKSASTIDEKSIYEIEIKRRGDAEDEWINTATWNAFLNNHTAVVNSGSASYIKLSFPVEELKIWDGNALNSFDEDQYRIDSLKVPFTIDDKTFENTLTVVQEYTVDPIQITTDDIALEVYAYNTGMIYKEIRTTSYKSCSSIYPECCGQNNIEVCFGEVDESYEYKQWLIDYELTE